MNLCTSLKTDFLALSQRTVLKRKHTPCDYKGPLLFFLSFGLLYKFLLYFIFFIIFIIPFISMWRVYRVTKGTETHLTELFFRTQTTAARMSVMHYWHVFVYLFAYLSGQYTNIIPVLQLLNVLSQQWGKKTKCCVTGCNQPYSSLSSRTEDSEHQVILI